VINRLSTNIRSGAGAVSRLGDGSLISSGGTLSPVGVSHWWDFSDITTLFQDVEGMTPITTANQPIMRVTDKQGAQHLSQSDSGKSPLYKTGEQNGKSIGYFDGSNDWLYSTGVSSLATPYTLHIVYKSRVISNNAGVNDIIAGTDRTIIGVHSPTVLAANKTPQTIIYAGLNLIYSGNVANQMYGVITCVFNGSSSELFENGVSKVLGDAGSSFGGLNTYFILGSISGGSRNHPIDVGEILFCSGAQTSGDIAANVAYLNQQWNVF